MHHNLCLPQLLKERARTEPDHVFLREVDTDVAFTYSEVDAEIDRWCRILDDEGVEDGDTVLVVMPTCAAAVHVWVALAWKRAIAVPINPDYRGRLLAHAIENSAAKVAVVHSDFLPQLTSSASDDHALRRVILADDPEHEIPPASTLQVRRPTQPPRPSDDPSSERRGPEVHDIAAILYTSGTTGVSKGVMVPWRQLHATVTSYFPDGSPDPGAVIYVPYPMFHLTGIGPTYLAALVNGTAVLRSKFKTSEYWQDVVKYECTTTLMIGSIADFLLNAPSHGGDAKHPLRDVMIMPLHPRVDDFEHRFGVRVCTLYGMTEVGVPINLGWERPRRGSCGTVCQGYHVRLVDEHDREVPTGEAGELVVRADEPWMTTAGYWRMPDATVASWRNMWFHTGDALRRDADGYFYFVDRVKDTMRRRGENVSSVELEQEILEHPSISECATVGMTGDWAEEEIKAFVVLRPGAHLHGAELNEFLASRVAAFMLPRFVEVVDELPRTPTGKVKKAELRGRANSNETWDSDVGRARR